MSAPFPDSIREAAELWAIRLRDPDFADWDGFTDWLEADPVHNAAYEAAADADEEIGKVLATPPAPIAAPAAPTVTPVQVPQRRPRWRWAAAGGAVAAAVAGVFAWTTIRNDSPAYAIETALGEHRTVALPDGSSVDLNAGTRLVLDKDTPRLAKLERGEALFHVRHNPRDPFVVRAGPVRLLDAGTVFNVVREMTGTRVAVAEGAVIFNPRREAIQINPGQAVSADDGGKPQLQSVATDLVGGWRIGRLSYTDTPLARIAVDLARNLGKPVRVAPGAGELRFTGTLALDGDAEQSMARIAPLLGVRAVPRGAGWTLTPQDRAYP